MGKLHTFWNVFRRHKYGFVIGLFVLLMGVVDENSLWSRYRHKAELAELRSEIRKYTEMYEHDTRYLEEMNTDPDVLIEIARERYYMKTDDEDIFVIQEKTTDEEAEKDSKYSIHNRSCAVVDWGSHFFYRLALCF